MIPALYPSSSPLLVRMVGLPGLGLEESQKSHSALRKPVITAVLGYSSKRRYLVVVRKGERERDFDLNSHSYQRCACVFHLEMR